jgi:hypothetical protein
VCVCVHARWSRDQIPVGARFSMPVQTSPEADPASCTVGTGCMLEVKWLGHGADHPSASSTEVVNGLGKYPCLPSVPA